MEPDLAPAITETHASTVVFIGDRAYKVKKPVDLGFLDFSTREARQEACRAEVELNRRLAPDVYLGVADVMGPDGAPCDHVVVMRRMPTARRLSTLVRSGVAVEGEVRAVARAIAVFHARAVRSATVALAGRPEKVLAHWQQSFRQMDQFVGTVLDAETSGRIEAAAIRYLEGRKPLLDSRIDAGEIVDGHGDLMADDIFCLPDGPRILDCLDFSDELRHGDVLADVGFLAMDLERLGRPDLGSRFLAWYREFSAECFPDSLAHHYVAYRAHVRAKVACLRHVDGSPEAEAEAQALLDLTRRHLDMGRVALVLIGGLPGTGKSTVAAAVGEKLRIPVLRSDEIRKELAGLAAMTPAAAPFGTGIYDTAPTNATYEVLLARAREALEHGQSVVLDASFTSGHWRNAAWLTAEATSSDLVAAQCVAPREVAAARLRARPPRADPSDATPEIAGRMAAEADPWPEATTIVTSGSADAASRQVLALLSTTG